MPVLSRSSTKAVTSIASTTENDDARVSRQADAAEKNFSGRNIICGDMRAAIAPTHTDAMSLRTTSIFQSDADFG